MITVKLCLLFTYVVAYESYCKQTSCNHVGAYQVLFGVKVALLFFKSKIRAGSNCVAIPRVFDERLDLLLLLPRDVFKLKSRSLTDSRYFPFIIFFFRK